MPVTQIVDHTARAVASLIEQYKDKLNVAGLLSAFTNQVQKVEDGLYQLLLLSKLGAVNLVQNPSFEVSTITPGFADKFNSYNNSGGPEPFLPFVRVDGSDQKFAQRVSWAVPNTTQKGISSSFTGPAGGAGGGVVGGWKPLTTYTISFKARASGTNIGQFMGASNGTLLAWNVSPASTVRLLCPPLSGAYQRYAWRITWGAATETLGQFFLSIASASGTVGTLDFDELLITEGTDLLDYQTTGANLDLLGRIVGEPRKGRTDLSFRTTIQARILLNICSGTVEEIYAIFKLLLTVNNINAALQLVEFYPKAFTLRVPLVTVTDTIAADLAAILQKAKDAGANADFEYGNTAPLFGFDGSTGAGFDTGYFGGTL